MAVTSGPDAAEPPGGGRGLWTAVRGGVVGQTDGMLSSVQTWTLLSALVALFGATVASVVAQQASLRGFLQARFDGLERSTAARFDAVAARFDGLEQATAARFDGLEQATAARFTAVDTVLGTLDRDVQALSDRVFRDR